MLCVEFIVVRTAEFIVQWYFVMLEFIVVTVRLDILQWYSVVL